MLFSSCFNAYAEQSTVYSFDIPSLEVEEALSKLATQASHQLLFSYKLVDSRVSTAVSGDYTLESALELMLTGTELSGRLTRRGVILVKNAHANNNTTEEVSDMKTKKSFLASAITFLLASGGQAALAQENDGMGESNTRNVLEEIVVTAQKREQSAQDVPIALTAISGSALANSGISSQEDLQLVTPGLQYNRGIGTSAPYIRGIGSNNTAPANESSVATYLDDFYIRDKNNMSQTYSGIDRVEVLKGPQGTLFGRNATGGVMQTITKTPSQDTEMIFEAHAGNFEVFGGDFYGTTGLGENLVADLMVAVQRQGEGYGTNLPTGDDVGYDEYTQVRSKWLWSPSDDTDVTLILSWGEKENDIGMLRTCADTGFPCFSGSPISSNFEDTSFDQVSTTESEGYLVGLRVDHSFGELNFVSLTSFQKYNSADVLDQDAGPLPLIVVTLDVETETFSQEFQLLSNYDSPLQWIAGFFYWDDKPSIDPSFISGAAIPVGIIELRSHLDTKSYALFGQADYAFTDATELTLGVRWTRDEKDIYGSAQFGPGASFGVVPFRDSDSWEEVTWRVALNHHLREGLMIYGSYNRGFVAGTFNSYIPEGVVQEPLEPEIVDMYAIGFKGDFFDGHLRVNAELYYFEDENMHLLRSENASTILFNAAETEATGLEVTATMLLSDNLTAQLSYSHMETEYTSFPRCNITTPNPLANGGFGGSDLSVGDCGGNDMMQAPDDTFGVVLNHSLPTTMGVFDTNVTYYYNSGAFAAPDERYGSPSYSVVNATLGWTSSDEKYQIGLYGNNLTEEEYSSWHSVSNFGDFVAIGIYPREYGVRFRMTVN